LIVSQWSIPENSQLVAQASFFPGKDSLQMDTNG
jgi:hypothetical protein